jgi:hypothetical protein
MQPYAVNTVRETEDPDFPLELIVSGAVSIPLDAALCDELGRRCGEAILATRLDAPACTAPPDRRAEVRA